MSDQINELPWKLWSLRDLAVPLKTPSLTISETGKVDYEQEAKLAEQQTLKTLHEQAQHQGHEQGFTQGQKEGFDSGYQQGLTEGREQGALEVQQQQQPITEQYKHMITEFQQTLDGLDIVITSRLLQLALTAAKQILGQPAICDGSALLNQIQQLIQQEPMLTGKPQLRVHPNDFSLVEERLGSTLNLHGWRLLADGQLHPGGCKVSAEEGDLDASLATRWHELCRLAAPGDV